MAKIKLTKNELKVQKDALKMYQRYLPTLTLKKQQLQSEIRGIEAKAKAVRQQKDELEKEFEQWIAVFSEEEVFPEGIITVGQIRKGTGNIAGVTIPTYEGADFSRGDYDLYETPLWVDLARITWRRQWNSTWKRKCWRNRCGFCKRNYSPHHRE